MQPFSARFSSVKILEHMTLYNSCLAIWFHIDRGKIETADIGDTRGVCKIGRTATFQHRDINTPYKSNNNIVVGNGANSIICLR